MRVVWVCLKKICVEKKNSKSIILVGNDRYKEFDGMKIAVYDVMDFEYPILARIKEEGKAELILTEKRLDKESMDFAAGCDGVTILGPRLVISNALYKNLLS